MNAASLATAEGADASQAQTHDGSRAAASPATAAVPWLSKDAEDDAASTATMPVPADVASATTAFVPGTEVAIGADVAAATGMTDTAAWTAAMPVAAVPVTTQPQATATVLQPAKPAPATPPASGAGSLGGALFALLLVVALILGLAWLARRMPGLGAVRANPSLRLVGSLTLSPRERVVVVAVGETQLLLGVGAGGTRTLHTLDAPLPDTAAATPSAFAQVLARQFGKKP